MNLALRVLLHVAAIFTFSVAPNLLANQRVSRLRSVSSSLSIQPFSTKIARTMFTFRSPTTTTKSSRNAILCCISLTEIFISSP